MVSNKLKVLMVFLVIVLGLSLYYLSLPVVLFVKPPLHEEYDLLLPGVISKDYRIRIISEENLKKEYEAFSPELVILSPFSEMPDYIDTKFAIWGTPDDGNCDIVFRSDSEAMWLSALDNVKDVNTAFLSEDNIHDDIFDLLKISDPYIHMVRYSARITSANINSIKEELENNGIVSVFVPSPDSAINLMAEDLELDYYVDWRDAAALYDIDVHPIAPDWSEAIKQALDMESGDIPFDFTVLSSHKAMKILQSLFL